jgi:hypothetical protein
MRDPLRDEATSRPAETNPPENSAPGLPAGQAFAHESEAEMARILDFYAVAWEYEPHRFPILWNLEGTVVESFSPDFYLPDLDLYLEMTTLRQRLVRKKNRKLRRLRELYPDVGIKLFYARDFRALMLKYGKLALVDALSGTSGQVGPIRVIPAALGEISGPILALEVEADLDVPAGDLPAADLLPLVALPRPERVRARPAMPASSGTGSARRGRQDGARRPARRPARPERPGSGW